MYAAYRIERDEVDAGIARREPWPKARRVTQWLGDIDRYGRGRHWLIRVLLERIEKNTQSRRRRRAGRLSGHAVIFFVSQDGAGSRPGLALAA